jgi:exodeoxyribonuclease VII large subunit
MNDKYLTVSTLTRYIKYKFDTDDNLKTVYLKGEISNFKAHTTGHFYFSLKDENSKINAIMFSANTKKIKFIPTDGMKVLVKGRLSIFESAGSYQIYIEEMLEDGIGNLYIAFNQLKEKLAKEGLFDKKYKKEIPKIPSTIGVITASTGAAIKDIISTIKRRYPLVQIILFPVLVQGENASADIAKKIKMAQDYEIDVLIVGRGGGSLEDLWPFNEEIVARAIFASNIPIISAVGHEVDFTIADFVADLRAPTPTGAAELAVPNLSDLKINLKQLSIRLDQNIYKKINYLKLYLETFKNSYVLKNPLLMYENKKQKLDFLIEKISKQMILKVKALKEKLNMLSESYVLKNPKVLYESRKILLDNIVEKLELINPLKVLKRGYSVLYKEDNIIISKNDLKKDDLVKIKLTDGYANAEIKGVE